MSTATSFAVHQLRLSMPAAEGPWEASVPEIVAEVVPETAILPIVLFCLGAAGTFRSVTTPLLRPLAGTSNISVEVPEQICT